MAYSRLFKLSRSPSPSRDYQTLGNQDGLEQPQINLNHLCDGETPPSQNSINKDKKINDQEKENQANESVATVVKDPEVHVR